MLFICAIGSNLGQCSFLQGKCGECWDLWILIHGFPNFTVVLKQENREEMDLSSVSSLSLTHCAGVKGLPSLQTQLSSPDSGLSHENLLSTSPRSLVCPVQQAYTPLVSSSVSQLSHIQGRNINPGEEHPVLSPAVVHQSFQVTSAPSARPSYQPMQSNVMFNGQSGLPMNSASQGFDAISFQQDAAAVPQLINLSCQPLPPMPYHSSNLGSVSTSAVAGGHPSSHPAQQRQSSPHLQSMGYHCPNPRQSSASSAMTQSLGHPSAQLQQVAYHPSNPGNASSPSPKSSHSMVHSPRSGPSSPQLQSMPYQTSSSGPASSPPPPTTVSHSGQQSPQARSPGLGEIAAASSLIHHNVCDASPFSPEEAASNVKPEPEDRELNFQTIGLQDITLDDGKYLCVWGQRLNGVLTSR